MFIVFSQIIRENVITLNQASFCLEDNDCEGEAERQFDCDRIGGGEQGITQGCADTYLYNLGPEINLFDFILLYLKNN